jgi:hypothetical protein
MNPNNGLHDGYGFVHFPCSPEGVAVALKAVSALSENPIVDNVHYSCEMSKNLLKLLQVQSQKRSQDAYAALNSHLQYSTRYNTHNYQNYAMPGQGYMPGSQTSNYFRGALPPPPRRPIEPPVDPSRLYSGSDYGAYGYQQGRKPVFDPLSLMPPALRPEQEEFPAPWADQQHPSASLSGSAPLGYEPAFSNNLRHPQDPYVAHQNRFSEAPNTNSRYPDSLPLRYSDPRYASDMRLLEHRRQVTTVQGLGLGGSGMPNNGAPGVQRRPVDPREVRPPMAPAPIAAPSSFNYGYSPSNNSQQPSSQTFGQQSSFRHEHGYAIEDFIDYPYPSVPEDTESHAENAEDTNKSVDDLNDLLSRHSISSAGTARIY